ncbi:hypothetical protein T484DRAFT_1961519 [Baffinella frigidus]|nr:hypothetical protein T484DRAFT_1961519 [Cryptophyta sp. CCMP2293]
MVGPRKAASAAGLALLAACAALVIVQHLGAGRVALESEEMSPMVSPMGMYQAQHPVFGRCQSTHNMDAFVTLVNRKCGDLGELQTCSDACVSALKTSVAAQGCCFETIMQGYEHMQPMAAQSWRRWQGLASGKCGVEFSTETCGHSVGEKPFHDLEQSVDHVQDQATENYDNFGNLIDKLLAPQYSPDPYDDYSYSDEPEEQYAAEPEQEQYAAEPMEEPMEDAYVNEQQPAAEERYADAPEEEQRGMSDVAEERGGATLAAADNAQLGDEVIDMPATPSEDFGDIEVPSGSVKPYMFKQQEAALRAAGGSLKVARGKQLYQGGGEDGQDYTNALRLGAAWRKLSQEGTSNPYIHMPGESWGGDAKSGAGAYNVRGRAGGVRRAVQSLAAEQEASQEEQEEEEEEQEPEYEFPMARGVLQGGGNGVGRPAQAGRDPINDRPLLETDPNRAGYNRLSPEAAVRQMRWDTRPNSKAHLEEGRHILAGPWKDNAEAPKVDAGSQRLMDAGVNV